MATHINRIGNKDTRNTIRESLNPKLIKKQKLNKRQIEVVVDLHVGLDEVMKEMEAKEINNFLDQKFIQDCAGVVREYEFKLQEAWGFEQNVNNHSWWFRVPHCTCPAMDNEDYVGTELNVFTTGCPVHGELDVEES